MKRLYLIIGLPILAVLLAAVLYSLVLAPAGNSDTAGNNGQTAQITRDFSAANTPEDFAIVGIPIMATGADVRTKLGKPRGVTKTTEASFQNPDWIMYWETWKYNGLDIVFLVSEEKGKPHPKEPGTVFSLVIKTGAFKTHRGIKVGDAADQVTRVYGKPVAQDNSYEYWSDMNCIVFELKRGRVARITIGTTFD